MEVPQGKIVTLIGANGAGKSSTLRAISGLIKEKAGTISYKGRDITHMGPVDVVKAGIVMAPEGRKIFAHLSERDNLMLGAYSRDDKAGIARGLEWVFGLFPYCWNARTRRVASSPVASSRCWP
jgi:branched-chain amino acid transport system ATP-binding protein